MTGFNPNASSVTLGVTLLVVDDVVRGGVLAFSFRHCRSRFVSFLMTCFRNL